MGSESSQLNKMKVFLYLATILVSAVSGAPGLLSHGVVAHAPLLTRAAGQVTHQSVSKPFQGEHRSTTQSKAFGAGIAAVADAPNRLHGARAVHGIAHPVVHAVARPVAVAHAPVIAHAPVLAHPVVGHAAAVYPDEPNPYTYTYAVNDDYSGSRFDATEAADGAGNASGSYSVALPDGRTQHVTYTANGYDGYVADVTYDGVAAYADAPVVAHAVRPVAVAHPSVGLIHG